MKNECKQECRLEKWANKVRALEQQQHSTIFVVHIFSLCKHQGGLIDKCQKMNKQVAFCRLHPLDFLFKSRVFSLHCFLHISAIIYLTFFQHFSSFNFHLANLDQHQQKIKFFNLMLSTVKIKDSKQDEVHTHRLPHFAVLSEHCPLPES